MAPHDRRSQIMTATALNSAIASDRAGRCQSAPAGWLRLSLGWRSAVVWLVAFQTPVIALGQGTRPPIRSLFGDMALEVRDEGGGTIAIGVAGAARAVTLSVRASDVRRWVDSASRLVQPARRRPARDSAQVQRARVILEEPGVGAGSFVLSRSDSAGVRTFLLFVDDAELEGVRQELELQEATTLVRVMRRALPPARPPRRPRR